MEIEEKTVARLQLLERGSADHDVLLSVDAPAADSVPWDERAEAPVPVTAVGEPGGSRIEKSAIC